jgi:iron complex outermembrane receptor protein
MKKILIYLSFWLIPLGIMAQFNLSGKIVDQLGNEILSGATIRLKNSSKSTVSDQNGEFRLIGLKTGSYDVVVTYVGYEKFVSSIQLNKDQFILVELHASAFMNDEIVVNASRITDKAPLTYSLIDKKIIQKQNNGTDLPYLLQSTPSVVVSSDAGTGIGYTGLRIRGTDLTGINVTLNGVPVNDPESHSVYFVDLPDLASSVDNIQIQRGAGTSANGAAAFGASLNIKTESPATEPYIRYNGTYGAFGTIKNTIGFGTGISKKGFSLNGRLSKIWSDGFVDRATSDLKSYFLDASWSGWKTHIKLLTTSGTEKTYQAWYGIPKDSLKTNRTYNPAGEQYDAKGNLTGYYDNQTDNYQQDYYQLLMAHQFSPIWSLSGAAFLTHGKGYYEEWKNDKDFASYGLPDLVIGNETISSTDLVQQKWLDNQYYGFNIAAQHQKERFSNTYGLSLNKYEGNHFGYISWARFASSGSNSDPWYSGTGAKTDFAAFAKSVYHLTARWHLFADLQWRRIDYQIKGTHDDLRDLTQNHDFAFLNPKTGVYFNLNDKQNFYASVAVTHREPTRTVNLDAAPGQEIFSERLIDYEAGYRFTSGKILLESNLYFMDYKNQFVLTGKINNVGEAIMTNVPESYRVGLETSAQWKVMKSFELSGNFSLSSNKIKGFTEYVDNWNYWDDPDNQPYQYEKYLGKTDISFSPSVTAALRADYKPTENLSFAIWSNYVSRQFIDNTSSTNRSIDPYLIGNASIRYTISQRIFEELSVTAHINNLFNTEYETNAWVYRYMYDDQHYTMDGYFPQAGIHAMFSLNVKL